MSGKGAKPQSKVLVICFPCLVLPRFCAFAALRLCAFARDVVFVLKAAQEKTYQT